MSAGKEELQAVAQGFPALVSQGFCAERLARSAVEHAFHLQFDEGHAGLKPLVGLDTSRATGMGLEAHAVREEVGTHHLAGTLTLSYRGERTAAIPFDVSVVFVQRELSSLRTIVKELWLLYNSLCCYGVQL